MAFAIIFTFPSCCNLPFPDLICYFQDQIQQPSGSLSSQTAAPKGQQPKKPKSFIHEKTKCSALGVYLHHAPDPVVRDVGGQTRSKVLGQLKEIAAEKVKVFGEKNKSVGMVALSDVAFHETWADIFTRTAVLVSHPDKSWRTRISGHMGEIARVTPRFLRFYSGFCDLVQVQSDIELFANQQNNALNVP